MSTDITSTVEEVAFGAAQAVRKVAADPMGSARRQVKGFQREGTPTARKVNRRLTARFGAATAPAKQAVKGINARMVEVAGDLLPERVAINALHMVKLQTKRQDMIGMVAKRALKAINRSLKGIVKVASRLERASELQARPAAATQTQAHRVRRSTRRTAARRHAA